MADNAAIPAQTSTTSVAPVPRYRVVNSNVYAIDVTDKFRHAASRLQPGSLVKDEAFTLFESVCALEIGDPKMDSGCVENGESLDDDYDVCKSLRPTEILWLMDELLSREVAWHMGYPLSQTLFTSVYIEKLLWPDPVHLQHAQFSNQKEQRDADPMLHKLFRSYCLGLIKSCDLVLGMVTGQHYYEEEDFATQLYNRDLLHRFPVSDILVDMGTAIAYIQGTALDEELKQSLKARMQFRSNILSMLSSHLNSAISPSSIFILDHHLLPSIQASTRLGQPIQEAFTLKIQRRLASTVPPRPMVTIDEAKTFDYLTQFVRDSENVFSVLHASQSQDLFTAYSIFSSQDPQPSVYVRALMQSWLGPNEKIGGISDELNFIISDLQSITLAASPVVHALQADPKSLNNDQRLVRQHLEDFLAKYGRSILNIWRTACLNRCRVRRSLCHAAMEWDETQAEAEELDDELQRLVREGAVIYPVGGAPTFSYSISSWVYHYKLTQLRSIVQLGFELEIYAPHELPSMYWHLSQLCDTHLAHLERINFFAARREAAIQSKTRHSAHEVRQLEECRASLLYLYRQFSWLKTTEATARALHCLYIVLQRHGQMQQPPTTYASDQLRYELRMKPFLYLSIPEPLDFEQCRRHTQMEVRTDIEILEEATARIAVAKKGWEEAIRVNWNAFPLKEESDTTSASVINDLWTSDIRGAVKASISASIAIATLRKRLEGTKSDTSFSMKAAVPRRGDKDYWHPWWLIPRITY